MPADRLFAAAAVIGLCRRGSLRARLGASYQGRPTRHRQAHGTTSDALRYLDLDKPSTPGSGPLWSRKAPNRAPINPRWWCTFQTTSALDAIHQARRAERLRLRLRRRSSSNWESPSTWADRRQAIRGKRPLTRTNYVQQTSRIAEREASVFGRLGVFAGSWSLSAAEAVCANAGVAQRDVLDSLERLVDKSLVVVEQRERQARYRLLEPVRQYASGLLMASGEWDAVRRTHALYYAAFAEARARDTNTGGSRRFEATAELAGEYPNIRLALAYLVENAESQF